MSTPYTPAAGSLDGPMCKCGTIMVLITEESFLCSSSTSIYWQCLTCGSTKPHEVKE